jgi:predicted RNA-binding protein with PIN domain
MRRAYLVDGYNLLFHLGLLDRRGGAQALEQARQRLLDLVAETLGKEDADVTVVFDSGRSSSHRRAPQDCHGVHVLYASRGEEADDVIEGLIAGSASPRQLIVVSNDRRLKEAARRRGAQSMSCEDFLDQREKPATRPAPAVEPERAGPKSRDEIRRWLAEFGDIAGDPEFRELFEAYPFEDLEEGS